MLQGLISSFRNRRPQAPAPQAPAPQAPAPQAPLDEDSIVVAVPLVIPPIVEERKAQLKSHLHNFHEIWNFYVYLETFTKRALLFLFKKYTGNNRDNIINHVPTFYRKPDNESQSINPDFYFLYDQHEDRILDIQTNLNSYHRIYYEPALENVVQECIEANPKWRQKYSHLINEFDKKKGSITKMFSDLQTSIAEKTQSRQFAERLVLELVHTKEYIDDLFNKYVKYRNYHYELPIRSRVGFDFELFEKTLLNIINNAEDDSPNHFDILRERERANFGWHPGYPPTSYTSRANTYILPTSITAYPSEGSSSEHSKLRYVGPPERFAPLDLHANDSKKDMPYLGGLKHYRSKRKLKTFRKRRNNKKSKRSKY
jgi:hypothetical protein